MSDEIEKKGTKKSTENDENSFHSVDDQNNPIEPDSADQAKENESTQEKEKKDLVNRAEQNLTTSETSTQFSKSPNDQANEKNILQEDNKKDLLAEAEPNLRTSNTSTQFSKSPNGQPNDKENSQDKEKIDLNEGEPNISSSNTANQISRQSHFYVLQSGSTSQKPRCHMPRTAGVNVKARRKLIIASILCVIFMLIEIIGGVLSNSLAIAADAAHTLTDFAGFMISLFAIWLAGRNPTDRLSFGWHRAEVIGALGSIITIWCVTAVLVWLAIQRCINQDFEVDAFIMMVTSVLAIITNIILGIQLMYESPQTKRTFESNQNVTIKYQTEYHHGHSHGCSGKVFQKFGLKLKKIWKKLRGRSKIPDKINQPPGNMNVHAAILHVLGDAIQSVGVIIAGLIIYIRPDWVLADPICTFIFAILVLFTTIRILKDILLVLMEGTPTYVDYSEIQEIFKRIDGVKSVHGLRVWALNIDKIALAVHLVTDHNVDATVILLKAEEEIHRHYHLYETTIQIEEDMDHLAKK